MTKPGVYYEKSNGKIWLVEKIEHYGKAYTTHSFSLILKGNRDGRTELNRCYISAKQFKLFLYLGKFT